MEALKQAIQCLPKVIRCLPIEIREKIYKYDVTTMLKEKKKNLAGIMFTSRSKKLLTTLDFKG